VNFRTVRDEVTLTPEAAEEAIQAVLAAGQSFMRIVFPYEKDEVSQIDFSLPEATVRLLREAKVNMETHTEKVRMEIPGTSIGEEHEDLHFRMLPVSDSSAQI
jgi:hypothetical protein